MAKVCKAIVTIMVPVLICLISQLYMSNQKAIAAERGCIYISEWDGRVLSLQVTRKFSNREGDDGYDGTVSETYSFKQMDLDLLIKNDPGCPKYVFLPRDLNLGDSTLYVRPEYVLGEYIPAGDIRYNLAPHYRNWEKFSIIVGSQVPVYINGKLTSIYAISESKTGRNYVALSEFCFQFGCSFGYKNEKSKSDKMITISIDIDDFTRREVDHTIGSQIYASYTTNRYKYPSIGSEPRGLFDAALAKSDVPSKIFGSASDIPLISSSQQGVYNSAEVYSSADVLVPIRFIAEGLGQIVEWDNVKKQVLITRDNFTPPLPLNIKAGN